MNINTLIIISCICMMFVIGKIFIVPIKWILKLVFNSIFGGFLIWIINIIGGIWGFHIGLNFYTSILVRNFGSARGNFSNSYKTYDLRRKMKKGLIANAIILFVLLFMIQRYHLYSLLISE